MNTIKEIEAEMAEIIDKPAYPKLLAEYHRLLAIMGNVDGDEVISLVIVAAKSAGAKP